MTGRRQALATLLALPVLARAGVRRRRICMIVENGESAIERGFRAYLELHRIEADITLRSAGPGLSRIPAILREARSRGTDLVYTSGAAVTLAVTGTPADRDPARHVTDIPVVFAGLGLREAQQVAGPAALRSNITGALDGVDPAEHVKAMLAYRRFRRIGIITNPASEAAMDIAATLRTLGNRQGFTLVERHAPLDERGVPIAASMAELVAALARQGVQLLYLGSDRHTVANRTALTRAALAQRLPAFSASELALRDGDALFGLAVPMDSLGRLAAQKAVRILRARVPPGAVPVGSLARPSLIINMRVAETLGLYPPVALLNRAEVLRRPSELG